MRPYQRALAQRRDELAAAGATAEIERLAVVAIVQMGLDPLSVVSDLVMDVSSRRIDLGGPYLLISWQMKTIRGAILMPDGMDWKPGDLNALRNARHDPNPSYGAVGHILSSPQLAGTSFRCEKRQNIWVETVDPGCDFFAVDDGAARWVASPGQHDHG
jgi:hypothetical protein